MHAYLICTIILHTAVLERMLGNNSLRS